MFAILLSVLAASPDAEFVAQKKEEAAPKSPPYFMRVTLEGGLLVHRATVTESRPVSKEIVVDDNGKKVKKLLTEYVTQMREIKVTFDPKKASIATAGGKKLDLDAVKKRFAKPQIVVVSADYKPIDETYLKLLDKDAIVIVPEKPKPDKGEKEDKEK
jgi:hypothetical protein